MNIPRKLKVMLFRISFLFFPLTYIYTSFSLHLNCVTMHFVHLQSRWKTRRQNRSQEIFFPRKRVENSRRGGGGILDLCRVFSSVDRSTRLEKFKFILLRVYCYCWIRNEIISGGDDEGYKRKRKIIRSIMVARPGWRRRTGKRINNPMLR